MDFQPYARRPFTVKAALVTEDNIEEVAKLTGTLKKKPDGTPFIQVNQKKLPGVLREIMPGFWVSKTGDREAIRVYSPRIFAQQFVVMNEEVKEMVAALNSDEAVNANG